MPKKTRDDKARGNSVAEVPKKSSRTGSASNIEDVYGLAPLQEAMLFRAVIETGSIAYVEQLQIWMDGAVDGSALREAWVALVARHPILRTSFHHSGLSQPQQMVHRTGSVPWRVMDLSVADERVADLAREEQAAGFELHKAPLFRLLLLRFADGRSCLVWTFHHLILDGWSLGRLLIEVGQLYSAALDGKPASLPPPHPFRDYLRWLKRQDRDSALAWWQTRLRGAPKITPLHGEREDGGARDFVHSFSEEETRAFTASCQRIGVTLATLARVAWAACLSEPEGVREVCFGTMVSGRPPSLPHVDEIVGLMVNTIATLVCFEPDETVHALLARLQREAFDERKFDWLPLSDCLKAAELAPLESVLVVENYPLERRLLDDSPLGVQRIDVRELADVPLVVAVVPLGQLELRFAAPPGGLSVAALESLAMRFAHWLRQLSGNLDATFSQLLGARERQLGQRIRAELHTSLPPATSLARAIFDQGPCIETGSERWQAGDVLLLAERTAREASAAAPGPIALIGQHSPNTIAQMFGCIRAGRAYVPLDESDPRTPQRLAHARAQRLVAGADDPVPNWPESDCDAYLLYTSGSTGRPKAVRQSHGAVLRHARRFVSSIGLQSDDILCATASFAYDAAAMDIFACAITGATLRLVALDELGLDAIGERLLADATVLHTTPSIFRLLTGLGAASHLRVIVLGGEAVTPTDFEHFKKTAPARCVLVNGFGPSESTTGAQWFANKESWSSTLPVGEAVEDTRVLLLDPDGRPRDEVWAEGEIAIESDAVALGYLGDTPDNERFTQHGEVRRFRTGDLGRRRPSGALDYLGRLDDQVQIGGVRVEPSEVALAVLDCPGVSGAYVLAVGDDDDRRLAAWVTPEDIDVASLREFLRTRLPPALRPSRVYPVPHLLLRPNGKVDRAYLLSIAATRRKEESATALQEEPYPSSDAAHTIADCFAEVLGKVVSAEQNFFEAGGHSLDALRASGRLERLLGRAVPLRLIFEHPSAAGLAAAIDREPVPLPAAAPIERLLRRWIGGAPASRPSAAPLISLFFFAGDAGDPQAGYELLTRAAIRADELGLHAIWTPERHFDGFGGLYPNPSLLAAHLAGRTQRIRLRAGSVVLPLHDPFRVAEEWALVDQLSGGRVDIAVASGWHRRDFDVLAPGTYAQRKELLFQKLDVLRRLWAGETIELPDSENGTCHARTWPQPFRDRLDIWLTSQSPDTFRAAGEKNLNVLTNLNYKTPGDLGERVAVYRAARGSRDGCVSLMMHTLVGHDDDKTRAAAGDAYARYTVNNLMLQKSHARGVDSELNPSQADVDALAASAVQRLLGEGSLIGDVSRCRQRIAQLQALGVNEIACLIDFGVEPERALEGVELLAELATPASQVCSIEPAATTFPAAPLQAQLWILDELAEDRSTWMIPTLVRLEGPLDADLLERRLQQIGQRHEALRTALVEDDGGVHQRVLQNLQLSLERVDVASEEAAIHAARRVLEQGVDLRRAPLARTVLYRVAEEHHVLLAACHHAIADGTSTTILARELLEGASDDVPLQPGDWASWLQARLDAGELAPDLAWWNGQLQELPARLDLAQGQANGRRLVADILIDRALLDACRAYCRRASCTAFELLLAAFAVGVGRATGRDDFLIGLHHENRGRPELENVVGPLVNLLPLRVRIPVSDEVMSIRDQARAAARRHEIPYIHLVEQHGRRDGGVDPLLDVAMVHQNLAEVSRLGELRWTRLEFTDGGARLPMTLVVRETGERLSAALEVDAGCFTEAAARTFGELFTACLTEIVGDTSMRPARIEATPAVLSAGPHLLCSFLEEARKHPNRIAVHAPDGVMSLATLRDGAARLAARLRRTVGPGARVGILLPPGRDMFVAVYGVLLADCTIVPLDLRDPPARRARELELARAAIVITHETQTVPHLSPVQANEQPYDGAPAGNHPAYIIFTSGSTGTPKGVVVGHESVRALIGWARQAFSEQELSAVLLSAPIRFDMSVFGLYVPLAGPGSVVVVPNLIALVDTRPVAPISLIYTVPSAMRALLTAGVKLPATTRTVNLGGEALDEALLRELLQQVSRVCDMYGPTESTSNAFFQSHTRPRPTTIGRPIAGTGAWVRRSDGSCAAVGEAGELVLTGAGLALGYLDAPDDPAFCDAGYRTGDRVRMLDYGDVEFLGRQDNQVKIRGHRLELGEVERQVTELECVCAAAARVRDDTLEAIVVVADAPDVLTLARPQDAQAWSSALAKHLSPEAVPTRWLCANALPLTPNGKLDRTAIAKMSWSVSARTEELSEDEEIVASIWEEILDTPAPDRTTSFFELGGHSLLAVQMRHRLEDRLQRKIGLSLIFDHPTIAGLSAALARAAVEVAGTPRLIADPAAANEPFPLTILQQAYWVGARDDVTLGGVDTQAYIEFDTMLPLAMIRTVIDTLVARHPMLRALVQPDGMQRVLATPGPFPLPVENLRDDPRAQERLAELRHARSHYRCDPADWPLLRVWAIRLPSGIRLQISLPALMLDAHSAYLLANEFSDLVTGRTLPSRGPDFRDVVVSLATSTSSSPYDFQELPPGPILPLRRAPATLRQLRFRRLGLRLETPSWRAIQEAAAARGMTPAGAVLSAFAWALSAWAEQSHYSLVVTYFDRPPLHPDINRVVGDFTSARLVSVAPADDLEAFCAQIQRRLWEAIDDPALDVVRHIRALRQRGDESNFGVAFTSTLGLAEGLKADIGDVVFALTQSSQVLLDHKVREENGALVCTWDLVDGLFCDGVPEAMLEVFEKTLRSMAANDWKGACAPLPSGQAKKRAEFLATDWSPRLPLLHETLLDTHSEAAAIVCGERRVSRKMLAGAASVVAHGLTAAGLVPGELVAITSRHGWQQAAAALGVMAAGGAWVPIDPRWPDKRIQLIIESAGVRRCVRASPDDLPGPLEAVVQHDSDLEATPADPPRRPAPDDLAYVIFTSGSTGVPKGVEITHAGAMNTIRDVLSRFVQHEIRVFGLSSLHFDLAVFDLFGAWLGNGAVIHPAAGESRDPQAWSRLVQEERITVWNSVPALALMLVEHLESTGETLDGLRLALLSGDWIPVDLPDRLRAVAPNCQVIGLGGATEASIWSIAYPIEKVDPDWQSIPYGMPLRGQGVHVLDASQATRPDWAVGEIHLSGRGVARGYRCDPERSAQSFWRHPTSGEAMYATGDMGRFRPEGWIEFLGRRDGQVKILGHRVELGEIEAAMRSHPQVSQGVVLARPAASGQRRLIAYVVGDLAEDELRAHLAARVPSHCLPQQIEFLESLPLTSNGKVDRSALATLGTAHKVQNSVERAPAIDTVRVLELMGEILERPDAGPDDDFFALGGDSILAVRLLGRLEAEFGCKIPIRELFRQPTSRAVAVLIATSTPSPTRAALDPVVRSQAKARRGHRSPTGAAWDVEAGRPLAQDAKRQSHRVFSPSPLPGDALEVLVGWLCSTPDRRRLHPSTGGAYGVQTYLLLAPGRVAGREGSWWLDPDGGALRQIGTNGWQGSMADAPPNTELARGAAFAIALVADLDTLEPLYGADSVRLANLEAGYMAQLLADRSARLDLSLCALGSANDAELDVELDLGIRRRVIHVMVGGRPLEHLIRDDASWTGAVSAPTPGAVLLTGATGQLGQALLSALLRRGHEVHCIIRGDANARLETVLERTGMTKFRSRVSAIRGSLSEAIDPGLARDIGTVIHAAADVSFVKPYPTLRKSNVAGTRAVVDLCARGAVLHHISSLSVFRELGNRLAPETESLPEHPPSRGGYAQSKWAAEQLVRDFIACGGRAHVHRLALVVSSTPAAGDYLMALHRACRLVKAWPDVNVDLPMVRLDVAAEAVAASIGLEPRTWHLQEPATVTVRQLAEHTRGLTPLTPARWLRRVENEVSGMVDHPLGPYLEVLRAACIGGALDPNGPSGGRLDGTESWRILHEFGVEPTADPQQLLTVLS